MLFEAGGLTAAGDEVDVKGGLLILPAKLVRKGGLIGVEGPLPLPVASCETLEAVLVAAIWEELFGVLDPRSWSLPATLLGVEYVLSSAICAADLSSFFSKLLIRSAIFSSLSALTFIISSMRCSKD